MIDSGILAGVTHTDADQHLYHRVMSLQVGLPLTVVDRATMARLAEVCAPLIGAHTDSFARFCETTPDRLEQALSVGNVITAEQLVPMSHFAHPLYRHMKDHLCVRLYECLHLLHQVDRLRGDDIVRAHFMLEDSNFETFVFRSGDDVVMVGPTFTQDHIGDGIARPHYALMQRELEKFNGSVRQFWGGAPGAEGIDRAIYTTDFLRNVSFQRDRRLGSIILGRIDTVKRALNRYGDVEGLCRGRRTSPRALVKAVAAIEAAHTSGKPGIFLTKGFDGPSPTTVPIAVAPGGMRIVEKEVAPHPSFEEAYARCMEDAFQHWSSFTGESLGRLRTWLLAEPFGGEGNRPPERAPDFGRRLARFLAATFDAYEATVYTVVYRSGVAQLSSVGAFSADQRGDERLQAMDRHMKSIAGTTHERDSISFRCLRENAVQYCQSYDYGSGTAVPRGQCITYPSASVFEFWGRSACAIPIRVNGILWGVLQLIGRRPHAFPEFIRARVEDACSIIGSHLFLNGLVGSVHNITRIISTPDHANSEKRLEVEAAVARILGSKTFAILRAEQGDGEISNVFLQSGRDDLVQASQRGDDPGYFAAFTAFAKGEASTWEGRVGEEGFRRLFATAHRKKFYSAAEGDFVYLRKITWDLGSANSSPGVVMLTFPHSLGGQDGWRTPVDFACQFVATITASLHSSDSWEKELREKIGHELSKTATNLLESVKRLENVERRDGASGDHELSLVRGDLSRHARALGRYTDILTTDRDVTDLDTDPRLYVVKELWAKWHADPKRRPAKVRELYNTFFFGKLAAFNEKAIEVPRLDTSLALTVKMDDLALGEVLATLAENILKYTMPGTGLVIRDESTSRNRGIMISNIGLRLDEDELLKIFRDNVRGKRARAELPTQGSGFGLYFAQQTMRRWNCGLRHGQRDPGNALKMPPGQEGQWAWHDFTLMFPRYLIV